MPFQWRMFFGHPYRAPGTTPNMFFMLSVTPDQWWALIFGIDTRKSASSTVEEARVPSCRYSLRVAAYESVRRGSGRRIESSRREDLLITSL